MTVNHIEELNKRKDYYELAAYIKENDIPLDVYAKFYAQVRHSDDSYYREMVYQNTRSSYFRGEKGIKLLQAYNASRPAITDVEEAHNICGLLMDHPNANAVTSNDGSRSLTKEEKIWEEAYNKASDDCAVADLWGKRKDSDALTKYIKENDVPIEAFARFVRLSQEQDDTFTWENVYQRIGTYFSGDKGDEHLKAYLKEGFDDKESAANVCELLIYHPLHNRVMNKELHTKEALTEREKLWREAYEKSMIDCAKYEKKEKEDHFSTVQDVRKKIHPLSEDKKAEVSVAGILKYMLLDKETYKR